MSPEISSIGIVVGLFLLGLVSPGPNFLVVAEHSLASGFRGGFVTGVGVAVGDGLYAAAGLMGVAAVIGRAGWLFAGVKLIGGLYIAWIGGRMLLGVRSGSGTELRAKPDAEDLGGWFFRGLLTDLSNPKTIVYFTGIFAATYDPTHPGWVAVGMWGGIVTCSLAWRAALALAFSRRPIRRLYRRFRRGMEALFGAALVLFGLRLTVSGPVR